MILHPENWWAGWSLILLGFLTGAVIGLGFQRDDFLGGYTAFPRRIVRLGHIALLELGALNLLFASTVPHSSPASVGAVLMIVGGVSMPVLCFLTSWRQRMAVLFFVPVSCLVGAAICALAGGLP
jgi:hypothetical protein